MNRTKFVRHKKLGGIVAGLVIGLMLAGCAGSSKKDAQPPKETASEQKGSLSRTFTLVDEQGRQAGQLVLDPFGGAIIHDANGKVIGQFRAVATPEAQPAATPPKSQSPEAQQDTKAKE